MLTVANPDEQPIIVMVKRKYCCLCFDFKFDVPTGLTTLEENCGKSTGVMPPGAQWCYCCNRRVACMVTRAIINYNAPVRYFNRFVMILLNRFIIAQLRTMHISMSIFSSPSACLKTKKRLRTSFTGLAQAASMSFYLPKLMRVLESSSTVSG